MGKPCACCGTPAPEQPDFYGTQYMGDVPMLELYECPGTRADGSPCRTTRAVRIERERAGREG